jgi:Ca-activated chloride channel homolog
MFQALELRWPRKVDSSSKFLAGLLGRAHLSAMFSALLGILLGSSALAEVGQHPSCYEDAMLIFDASGSMSGMEEYGSSSPTTRIDDARAALAKSLPRVTPYRRLGLMTYGPGLVGHCDNITLNMRPEFNAGGKIMALVNTLDPDGLTPLTSAVAQAAEVLDYRNKPALVVLFTDGEETCDGKPCELAKTLKATGKAITVHVIGYRMQDIISARERGVTEMKCLAAQTGGRFISAGSIEELVDAFNTTLGCPLLTRRKVPSPNLETLARSFLR